MDTLKVKVGDKWFKVDVVEFSPSRAVFLVDGDQITVTPSMVGQDQHQDKSTSSSDATSLKSFTAPMPGTVIEVLVEVGQQVNSGDVRVGQDLIVLESMKMQQVLRSEVSGVVESIEVSEGEQILDGHVIFKLES